MASPEVTLERFLTEKQRRREKDYAHILGRAEVEDLPSDHLHHWLVEWMNLQLGDIGVNSTGGQVLPPLHFDLVRVQDRIARAHAFETEEFGFIVVTEPMVEEMRSLSMKFVQQNRPLVFLQIATDADAMDVADFLVFLQFCLVTTHEYSHFVRRHYDFQRPHAAEIGEVLTQAQECDADGFGIYHDLTYLLHGAGRPMVSRLLKISNAKVLETSIVDCFLLAIMIQFCARWAGKVRVDANLSQEHPPPPMRMKFAILFVEMWCREIGFLSTTWMNDGTLARYFAIARRLFPAQATTWWDELISWLNSPAGGEYEVQLRAAVDRIRTGRG